MTGSASRSSASARTWRFLDSGTTDGASQMRRDRELFAAADSGGCGPVFRFYGWKPWAVSLGLNQDPEREIDAVEARRRGIDVVRRPTGGRAILHAEELTYAVVAPLDDPLVGGGLRESHARISAIFLTALRSLGVPATFGGPLADPTAAGRSTPCFSAATRTELVVRGRKILGSAQRRGTHAFLQHGSLLLGDAHLGLADLLRIPVEERARWRERLESVTTTLAGELPEPPSRERLIGALEESLAAAGFRAGGGDLPRLSPDGGLGLDSGERRSPDDDHEPACVHPVRPGGGAGDPVLRTPRRGDDPVRPLR